MRLFALCAIIVLAGVGAWHSHAIPPEPVVIQLPTKRTEYHFYFIPFPLGPAQIETRLTQDA